MTTPALKRLRLLPDARRARSKPGIAGNKVLVRPPRVAPAPYRTFPARKTQTQGQQDLAPFPCRRSGCFSSCKPSQSAAPLQLLLTRLPPQGKSDNSFQRDNQLWRSSLSYADPRLILQATLTAKLTVLCLNLSFATSTVQKQICHGNSKPRNQFLGCLLHAVSLMSFLPSAHQYPLCCTTCH